MSYICYNITNKIYNITNTCMKYIINMICAIYKINNKSVSKTICNRCITCNESLAVITSQSDCADHFKMD